MASDKTFNYYTVLWVMPAALESAYYFEPNMFQLRNDSIEDNEVDNHLEKLNFAGLVKDA